MKEERDVRLELAGCFIGNVGLSASFPSFGCNRFSLLDCVIDSQSQ